MEKLVLIAAGSAIGGVCRYALAGSVQRFTNSAFPLGTLAVNLLGCFLIGFLATLFTGPYLLREEYRIAVLVGLLGGFTTFSSFGWETFALMSDRQFGVAFVNALLHNGLGLIVVWLGVRLAKAWHGV